MDKLTFDTLKNISVADLVLMIIENSNVKITEKENKNVYYTAKELIELYPNIFSKYKLDKYIKYDNFPVIKEGKERFFLKANVEKWLENKNLKATFRGV